MLIVLYLGGLTGGPLYSHKSAENKMETDDKNLFKYKLDYLKLVLEITGLRLKGKNLPMNFYRERMKKAA
jgi:hypothetical protein